ncbi:MULTISPECIES: hypothetical protein [Streptomyces]|uniref:Uncharacterized protein n=1 Tax=Streptomyces avermitilis TaxID=33903 RepID=A0A4D4N6V0_STRAX|nr:MULTISPECIES: hypothetical protein [Streptomyces]MYS95880.1 hypothetical protein [Streptomyces sp. SID5469]GDY80328.1 hypothetical protein SAV31267_098130 [Streptomyces avermitilis]
MQQEVAELVVDLPGPLQQEAGEALAAGLLGYRQAVHFANGHAQDHSLHVAVPVLQSPLDDGSGGGDGQSADRLVLLVGGHESQADTGHRVGPRVPDGPAREVLEKCLGGAVQTVQEGGTCGALLDGGPQTGMSRAPAVSSSASTVSASAAVASRTRVPAGPGQPFRSRSADSRTRLLLPFFAVRFAMDSPRGRRELGRS